MKSEEKKALIAAMFQGANMKVEQFIAVNEGTVVYNDYKGGKGEPLGDAEVVECEEVCIEAEECSSMDELLSGLTPIFWNDRNEAQLFLKRIEGLKPKDVTLAVNNLLDAKKISSWSAGRDLYQLLHRHGYYKASESNWNKMVKGTRRHN